MLIGFCPNCGNMILEVYNLDWKGEVTSTTYRREKARKLYEKLKSSIIGDYFGKIRYGTKTNMGFCYGDSSEIHNNLGEVIEIRSYAVDFNGTKQLIKTIKVK